jgi:hypothetical protein
MSNDEFLNLVFDIGPIIALAAAAAWMIKQRLR